MSKMASLGNVLLKTQEMARKTLTELTFDNKVLSSLPVDNSFTPGSRQVPNACFSLVKPTPVVNPTLVASSKSALALLDVGNEKTSEEELADYFSGNKLLNGSTTAAHCYCGHQFGYFSGQLGDGAAIYLGEIINNAKDRWEIQIKGAGPTPYSRSSDGRKVLRSTIREFLCSEAMHHLGIPSTRAGTCVTSDTKVVRDIFYDGHPRREQCTTVLRIAPTFLRFGSFEIFKPMDEITGRAGPSVKNKELLFKMLDYTVETFYGEETKNCSDKIDGYAKMFKEVCIRTAKLVAKWQSVGFCHGVLNTDNMSIMGLTIDYGPFGFMDRFDENFICNSSDDGGRYTYKKQPEICKWNLEKFAEAIKDAVPMEKTMPYIQVYYAEYNKEYLRLMRNKLGLLTPHEDDENLIKDLFAVMQETSCDFTNTFLNLTHLPFPGADNYQAVVESTVESLISNCNTLDELKQLYKPQMDPEQLRMILTLVRENPGVLQALTGGKVGAIKREMDNLEKNAELQAVTEDDHKNKLRLEWDKWINKYVERLKLEVDIGTDFNLAKTERSKVMRQANPQFILRNHIAQNAIDKAEEGNYEEVRNVLKLLENPFMKVEETSQATTSSINTTCAEESYYVTKPPSNLMSLKVS